MALPYRFIVDDTSKPILSVAHPNYDQKEAGWYRATSLSTEYLKWLAARRGMNYQDFQETDWSYQIYDHWTQRQQDYYLKWESTVIEYPHCILPPIQKKLYDIDD